MISFYKRLFLRKRQKRFDAFNVLLKMLLKRGKFSMAYFLMDKLFSILKVYIYTFWQKRKLERIVRFNNNYRVVLNSFNVYTDMLKFWLNFVKVLYSNPRLQKRAVIFCLYFFVRRLKNFLPKFSFFCKFFSNINLPETDTMKNSYMRIASFSERLFFYKPIISRLSFSWKNSLAVFCTCFLSIYMNFIDNNFSNKLKFFGVNVFNSLKNEPMVTLFFSLYQKYVFFLIKLIKYRQLGGEKHTTKIFNFTNLNSFHFFSNYNSNFLKVKVLNFWLLFVFFCFLKKTKLFTGSKYRLNLQLILFLKFYRSNLTLTSRINLQKRQYKSFSLTFPMNGLMIYEYDYKKNIFSVFNLNHIFNWSFSFSFFPSYFFLMIAVSSLKLTVTTLSRVLKNTLFIFNLMLILFIEKKLFVNDFGNHLYRKFFSFVNRAFNFSYKKNYSLMFLSFREKIKIFLFKKLNYKILFIRKAYAFFFIRFFYYYLDTNFFANFNNKLKLAKKFVYGFFGNNQKNLIKSRNRKIISTFSKWACILFPNDTTNFLSLIKQVFFKYSTDCFKNFEFSTYFKKSYSRSFELPIDKYFVKQLKLFLGSLLLFKNRMNFSYLKRKNIVNKNLRGILNHYEAFYNFINCYKKFNIKFYKNTKLSSSIYKAFIFKLRFSVFLI